MLLLKLEAVTFVFLLSLSTIVSLGLHIFGVNEKFSRVYFSICCTHITFTGMRERNAARKREAEGKRRMPQLAGLSFLPVLQHPASSPWSPPPNLPRATRHCAFCTEQGCTPRETAKRRYNRSISFEGARFARAEPREDDRNGHKQAPGK